MINLDDLLPFFSQIKENDNELAQELIKKKSDLEKKISDHLKIDENIRLRMPLKLYITSFFDSYDVYTLAQEFKLCCDFTSKIFDKIEKTDHTPYTYGFLFVSLSKILKMYKGLESKRKITNFFINEIISYCIRNNRFNTDNFLKLCEDLIYERLDISLLDDITITEEYHHPCFKVKSPYDPEPILIS